MYIATAAAKKMLRVLNTYIVAFEFIQTKPSLKEYQTSPSVCIAMEINMEDALLNTK